MAWKNYEQMARYRRPLSTTLATLGLVCSTLALGDAFDVVHVPGGKILAAVIPLLLAATWFVMSLGLRTNQANRS